MKRPFSWFFAVYFLAVSFCPKADVAQLWHVADAFKHYHLHTAEAMAAGDAYSLWSFLKEHYIEAIEHTHENDQNSHDQLPVQHMHEGLHFAMQMPALTFDSGFEQPRSDAFTHWNFYYCFDFSSGIDHPPSQA